MGFVSFGEFPWGRDVKYGICQSDWPRSPPRQISKPLSWDAPCKDTLSCFLRAAVSCPALHRHQLFWWLSFGACQQTILSPITVTCDDLWSKAWFFASCSDAHDGVCSVWGAGLSLRWGRPSKDGTARCSLVTLCFLSPPGCCRLRSRSITAPQDPRRPHPRP